MRRRAVIGLAGAAPALLLFSGSASAAEPACFNPETLPASQKSLRRALGFELTAKDQKKICSGCAYFTAKSEGCGTCVLFSGGPVTAKSACRNWSRKA